MKLDYSVKIVALLMLCASVCCELCAQNNDSAMADLERRAEVLRMNFQEERKAAASDLMFIGELGYEHHERYGHMVHSNMFLRWDAAEWFSLLGGIKVTTRNIYDFSLRADFRLPLGGYHYLGLRNQYLYCIFANHNNMDFNMSLAAFYEQDYFYLAAGAMTHFETPVSVKEGSRTYNWYVNWIYDLRVWCRVHDASWNLGVQFTNMRDFELSHCNMPSFILNGKHLIIPKSTPFGFYVNWQAGCRTVIVSDGMSYDGAWGMVGVSCYF